MKNKKPSEYEIERKATSAAIIRMLRNNTGAHLLDSGGAYGRHWQRNAKRDFRSEPDATIRWEVEYALSNVCISLYHYLMRHLRYEPKMNQDFHSFYKSSKWKRESWEDTLEAYFKDRKFKVHEDNSEYTYNCENVLDQDFVYWPFETEDRESGCVIRSHNGCDARGGFSRPYFFTERDEPFSTIYNVDHFTLSCDGSTQEPRQLNLAGEETGLHLHTWDYIGQRMEPANCEPEWSSLEFVKGDSHEEGKIVIVDEKTALCPVCGSPLKVYAE